MFSFRRHLLDSFLNNHKEYINGNVLDIGGRKENKRGSFIPPTKNVKQWVYLNPNPDEFPDIIASSENMPIENDSVDTVIFTEVLEYIDDPRESIKEIYRVLRKEGVAIITTPFLYPVHGDDKFDKLRFTKSYLMDLFQEKFSIIKIEPMGSVGSVIFDILRISLGYAIESNKSKVGHKILNKLLWKSLFLFKYLDNSLKDQNKYVNTGYFILLKK